MLRPDDYYGVNNTILLVITLILIVKRYDKNVYETLLITYLISDNYNEHCML